MNEEKLKRLIILTVEAQQYCKRLQPLTGRIENANFGVDRNMLAGKLDSIKSGLAEELIKTEN